MKDSEQTGPTEPVSLSSKALRRCLKKISRLQRIKDEAIRIQTEAHLANDAYAYDLMRSVLGAEDLE